MSNITATNVLKARKVVAAMRQEQNVKTAMIVDDEFVEAVEDECGGGAVLGPVSIHPTKQICEAAIKVYHKRLRERVIEREKMSPLDREYHDLVQSF